MKEISQQQIKDYLETQLERAYNEVMHGLPDDCSPLVVCPSVMTFGMLVIINQIKFINKEGRKEFIIGVVETLKKGLEEESSLRE
jgi:hypothetical protein